MFLVQHTAVNSCSDRKDPTFVNCCQVMVGFGWKFRSTPNSKISGLTPFWLVSQVYFSQMWSLCVNLYTDARVFEPCARMCHCMRVTVCVCVCVRVCVCVCVCVCCILSKHITAVYIYIYIDVTECIVYMFRAIPFNLFFPVLFLFDWVGVLWPNYLRC